MSPHAILPEPSPIMKLEDFGDVELFAVADAFVSSGEFDFDPELFGFSRDVSGSHNSIEDTVVNNTSSNVAINQVIQARIVSRKADLAARRRESRQRVKSSRDALQLQAHELENELARLKQVHKMRKAQADLNRPAKHFLWRQIAARELRERLQAEAEQRSLAAFVESQKIFIADLTDQARKWLSYQEGHTASTKKLRSAFENENDALSEDDALCNAYIRELEANYSRIDDVFLKCGMESLPEVGATAQSTKLRADDSEVDYYELVTKLPQPSSLQETAHEMWNAAEKQFFSKNHYERCNVDSKDPENTVFIKYCDTKTLETGEKISLAHQFFLRRFTESNRIVSVWKCVSEGSGYFRGVHFEETGWNCIRCSSDPTNTGTIFEMCQRWTPMRYSSSGSSEKSVGQFYDVLLDSHYESFNEIVTSMGKLSIGNS